MLKKTIVIGLMLLPVHNVSAANLRECPRAIDANHAVTALKATEVWEDGEMDGPPDSEDEVDGYLVQLWGLAARHDAYIRCIYSDNTRIDINVFGSKSCVRRARILPGGQYADRSFKCE